MSLSAEKNQTVQQNINEMIAIVQDLDEKTIRWNPSEDEWSIMQIIVHVGEAIPFWLQEIDSIKNDPMKKWGRGLSHEGRLYAVSKEKIKNTTIEEAISQLKVIPSAVEKTTSTLTEEQLQTVAPSRNPNFTNKPVQFIVDKLIVKHVEGHLSQIKRNLSKLGS